MPVRGVFVTGTDTGVGKTWIGAAVIRKLIARGVRVVPRKPAESGCETQDGALFPADAAVLHAAAEQPGRLLDVCPYRFRHALSPARAARLEKAEHLTLAGLEQACVKGVSDDSFVWVEGAGGFYSPLAADGLNADLAAWLSLPVLLVAADRLGCINHVLLSQQAIQARGLSLVAVVLNQVSVLQPTPGMGNAVMDNLEDLRQWTDAPLIRIAYGEQPAASAQIARLAELLMPAA
ncbi:MAG: dethiobiotin synthase [Gammaproteobacteria bacterium]|nr:dethiobiotin synthase [Gammaproteobacteria bacterium]